MKHRWKPTINKNKPKSNEYLSDSLRRTFTYIHTYMYQRYKPLPWNTPRSEFFCEEKDIDIHT